MKIGFLVFAEGNLREDVYLSRKLAKERETKKVIEALSHDVELIMPEKWEIRSKKDLSAAILELNQRELQAGLFFIPTFVSASIVALAVRMANFPCALLGNKANDTFSQVGFMASAGALEQAGLFYKRITGDIAERQTQQNLLRFFRAAAADKAMLGKTYGMFGGRSLGISTGTADPSQWLQLFGVDIEHIDQFQIVRSAGEIDSDRVDRYISWIKRHYGALQFQADRFSEEHLEQMVRSYLAVKDLIKLYQLDFIGIKCQPELSNGYILQCLTVQLLNDPYDADGPKEPVVCSCEADADGAITMEILKQLSGGKPTALQDIYCYDENTLVLANCGSSASYFSKCSPDMKANLGEVHMIPHGFGVAGGASTQFTFAPGVYTYARLFRFNRNYKMAIFKGQTKELCREELRKYAWYRPTAIVDTALNIDINKLSGQYCSNHIHCVEGDIVEDLIEYCQIKKIDYMLLNKE